MTELPRTLIPYDRREALALKEAAHMAGRSKSTLRSWCLNHNIGRRVGGGPWQVSRPALLMFLDNDKAALRRYHAGDRDSETVLGYFNRARVPVGK